MASNKTVVQLRKLSQQFAYTSIRMHETIGKEAGFAGTDHKYLGFLLQKGQMSAGELANLTGLTTGAVTGLIDRFEKKKLVKRQLDKEDRRKIIIVPDTDKIAAILRPLYQDFQDKTDKLFASFTAEQLKTLERYFEDALEIMNRNIATLTTKQ
jgi:DNA-binding MarR family transcriptional regulator